MAKRSNADYAGHVDSKSAGPVNLQRGSESHWQPLLSLMFGE